MPVHICHHHQSYSRVTSHLRLNWQRHSYLFNGLILWNFFGSNIFCTQKFQGSIHSFRAVAAFLPAERAGSQAKSLLVTCLRSFFSDEKIEPSGVAKPLDFFGEIWQRVRSFHFWVVCSQKAEEISHKKIGAQLHQGKVDDIYLFGRFFSEFSKVPKVGGFPMILRVVVSE